MRFFQIIVLLVFVVVANGGKVIWDKDSRANIKQPTKPLKGCEQGGLNSIIDNNKSSNCLT